MRRAVKADFVAFTAPLEGVCTWMYLDILGLVTTGIGNLVDDPKIAARLPFILPGGTAATVDEIHDEWRRVKARKDLAQHGGGAFKKITRLRLTPEGIDVLVGRKLYEMDAELAARFPGYEEWCCDAQLGVLSMAWAMGPAFRFPRFEAAVSMGDFATASAECQMNATGNPGLVPRNKANRTLFLNAAVVVAEGLDPDVLYFPTELGKASKRPPCM